MTGVLETQVQKRATREKIQSKILIVLTRLTTQSSSLAFAPEAVLIKKLGLNDGQKWKPSYQIRQALRRLEKKGLVRYQRTAHGWTACLSPRGKKRAERLDAAERIKIRKPRRWDGRWRIVIFDIWERRRAKRDRLRHLLQKAGFYKIQNSVWVHPYDCEELIAFLRADMHLGQGVLYIIAEGIENDYQIRKHFDLS